MQKPSISRADSRDRYRRALLPDIARAETQFDNLLHEAETTDNENWRIWYFLSAHLKARDLLRQVKGHWPRTRDGMRAHGELVRYYELITEDFAIIRTQMSLDEKMDYLAAWRKVQAERVPIHKNWERWVRGDLPANP